MPARYLYAISKRHFVLICLNNWTQRAAASCVLPLFGGEEPHNSFQQTCSKECLVAQGAKPRVAFALASAISAAVEGSTDAAQLVADSGGIALLVRIMRHGSGHGKKAAAEALQVLRLCPVLNSWRLVHMHDARVRMLIR